MAFENCVNEVVAAGNGRIDRDEAEAIIQRLFDRSSRYEKRYGYSRAEATERAAREQSIEERIAAALQRRDAAINALRRDALDARVTPGREQEAVSGLLGGVEGRGRGLAQSIDAETHANSGRLMGGLIADLRNAGLLKPLLRRNKLFERDIAREMWRLDDPTAGAPTGNKLAEQVAVIINRWQETARAMENEAGAHINKLDHYVSRQSHDMEKVRGKSNEAAYQAWRDFIEPKLDERTFEGVDDREKFLSDVWHALASGIHETANGADWLGGFQGGANLGKKLSQERKLHFKSADDWLAYNERYGKGNVVDSVVHGLEHAGRNTALMRNLGTNPDFMFKSWVNRLAEDAKNRSDFKTSDALRSQQSQHMLDILNGKSELPANLTIAHVGHWIRTAESLAKLGAVVLSSLPDIAVNVASLRWSGVPLLKGYANTILAPLLGRRSGQTRQVADLLGVGIDGMRQRLLSRFMAEERYGQSNKLIEQFHRLNFLTFWTDSLKTGMGLMLSRNLAQNAGHEFAALPGRLQTTLRRYGIEAPEWNALRQTEQRAADGRSYIMPGNVQDLPDAAIAHLAGDPANPAELARIRDDLQTKLSTYIMDISREAMTEPTVADRLITARGAPGTVAGEAARLFMQFKQYPMTYLRRSIGRELRRDGVDVAGLAHLIAATTLIGYVSMTLKELVKGRDPRHPQTPGDYAKLVAAAMTQGGGLGIYGDFLFGDANRLGGGFVGTLAGPALGTLEDAHKLFTAIRDGSDTKSRWQIAGSEGLQVLKNNAPFLNLFYTRAALDYFILNRLQEAMNPGYLRRYEQKVKKENAQDFWLRPTSSPYR